MQNCVATAAMLASFFNLETLFKARPSLGSVLENLGELVVVKHAILDRSLSIHLVNLIISEPVTNGGRQLPESVLVKEANIVLVKTSKRVLDDILGISSLKSLPKHGEEHGEVDGAGGLAHHPIQVLLSGVLAQAGQHVVQILVIDEPVPVLVNHVEGLLAH